ncbi:MAG: DinB family protein [Methylocella sp.]
MARYNRWQNRILYAAADRRSEDERRKDRGAYFRSIHAMLNHVLWAGNMWMSRVADVPKPAVGIPDSVTFCDDWERLKAERACFDERIIAWADSLDKAWLSDDLAWYSQPPADATLIFCYR